MAVLSEKKSDKTAILFVRAFGSFCSTFLPAWCIIHLSNFSDRTNSGMRTAVRILKETGDYIAVYKSAGEAVESKHPGQRTLTNEILNLAARRRKPGPGSGRVPFAAAVNRLDQPVEGIVLFAMNPKAAAELTRQMTEGKMRKEYLAVVSPPPERGEDVLIDWLLKDGRRNLSSIVPEGTKGARRAELSYRVLEKSGGRALLRIRLVTGRHHQIRVQLSGAGFPILGDRKYGNAAGDGPGREEIRFPALCAERLVFCDPGTEQEMEIRVSPEGAAFRMEGIVPADGNRQRTTADR